MTAATTPHSDASGAHAGIRNDVDVTFFIPCLNEESRVVPTLETLRSAMQGSPFTYEVIVVDDGSTDRTSDVVEDYRRKHSDLAIRLHRNPINLGLAHSFVDAAFLGRGTYFRLVCGDNIEPAESMKAVIDRLGQADLVVPYYPHVPGKSRSRLMTSRVYTALVNLVSGHRLRYYNGNPLYRRVQILRWAPHNFGFGYQADLLTQLLDQKASYLEIAISGMHRDKGGTSSVSHRNLLSVAHSLLEIALRRIRRTLFGRSAVPATPPAPEAQAAKPGTEFRAPEKGPREAQYGRLIDIQRQMGLTSLGLMTNQAWYDDPRHLVFTLSRYKFVAKMFAGRTHVLEVGCADAFASRIVVQSVGKLTATDFDPIFIADVQSRMDPKWRFECKVHDILSGPVAGEFDAAYALDVIEHIQPKDEVAFVGNIARSLLPSGSLILGCPSIQSQAYASKPSREGHVNCKDGDGMKELLSSFFENVFVFSMNDEVIHTGYSPMAHYIIGLGCGRIGA